MHEYPKIRTAIHQSLNHRNPNSESGKVTRDSILAQQQKGNQISKSAKHDTLLHTERKTKIVQVRDSPEQFPNPPIPGSTAWLQISGVFAKIQGLRYSKDAGIKLNPEGNAVWGSVGCNLLRASQNSTLTDARNQAKTRATWWKGKHEDKIQRG